MKTYLGIDFGNKRIGLSLASTPIAEPMRIIPNENAINTIKNICDKNKVTDIVVGISEAKTKKETLEFIKNLEKEIDLPIHQQDETLSSYQVKEHFLESGVKKRKLHGHIDHFSATLILEEYLEENN